MPTDEPKPLSPKQERALLALLAAPTFEAAAAAAKVDPKTLRTWLRQPEFKAAVHAARREILDRATSRLQAIAGKAVETLERNLDCGSPAVEIRAAAEVLDRAAGLGELSELADQLEELTKAMRTGPESG